MLSQDLAGLKAGHWRDPQQGFVSMRHVKPSGITFSLLVPYMPGDRLLRSFTTTTFTFSVIFVDYQEDRALINEDNLWDLTVEQRARLILTWMARLEEEDAHTAVGELVDKQSQVQSRKAECHRTVFRRTFKACPWRSRQSVN